MRARSVVWLLISVVPPLAGCPGDDDTDTVADLGGRPDRAVPPVDAAPPPDTRREPDVVVPDTGSMPDVAVADMAMPSDAGPPEDAASAMDGGTPPTDAGADAGPELDATIPDAAPMDASPADAGPSDAGSPDTGPADAGTVSRYRSTVLASGPIAYWPFDETTGTVSTDIVGGRVLTSRGGVTMATPSLVAGSGDAVRFEGTGWASMAAHDPSLQHNPYSLEVWLRHDAVSDGNIIAEMRGPDARGWTLGSQLFGWDFAQGTTTGEWLAGPRPSHEAARTYHVVVTYDGVTLRLYVDGVLQGSA
ncbi:MAG: hypothetical protein IT379_26655, partial [Deltaproteobacteria bacterium]|nr:hypothetical protein [Deltaproteobacteria bacterium]